MDPRRSEISEKINISQGIGSFAKTTCEYLVAEGVSSLAYFSVITAGSKIRDLG